MDDQQPNEPGAPEGRQSEGDPTPKLRSPIDRRGLSCWTPICWGLFAVSTRTAIKGLQLSVEQNDAGGVIAAMLLPLMFATIPAVLEIRRAEDNGTPLSPAKRLYYFLPAMIVVASALSLIMFVGSK